MNLWCDEANNWVDRDTINDANLFELFMSQNGRKSSLGIFMLTIGYVAFQLDPPGNNS